MHTASCVLHAFRSEHPPAVSYLPPLPPAPLSLSLNVSTHASHSPNPPQLEDAANGGALAAAMTRVGIDVGRVCRPPGDTQFRVEDLQVPHAVMVGGGGQGLHSRGEGQGLCL
jgi:hypothetical protein